MKRRLFSALAVALGSGSYAFAQRLDDQRAPRTSAGGSPTTTRKSEIASRQLTLRTLHTFQFPTAIVSFALANDGTKIAVSTDFGTKVTIVDISNGRHLAEFKKSQTPRPQTLSFSIDGDLVISTAADTNRNSTSAVGVWNANTGALIRQLEKPQSPGAFFQNIADSVQVSPDGAYIVAIGRVDRKQIVAVYDQKSWTLTGTIGGLSSEIGTLTPPLAISRDNLLAVQWIPPGPIWRPRRILVFDLSTCSLIQDIAGHIPQVSAITWSPDGADVLSGGGGLLSGRDPITGEPTIFRDTDPIRVWNGATGEKKWSITGEFEPIHAVAWHPTKKIIGAYGIIAQTKRGGALRFWDVESHEMLLEFVVDGLLSSMEFSNDGANFVTAVNNQIKISEIND